MTTETYAHRIVTPDLSDIDWTAPATDVFDEVYDRFMSENGWIDLVADPDDTDRITLMIDHRVDRLVTANLV